MEDDDELVCQVVKVNDVEFSGLIGSLGDNLMRGQLGGGSGGNLGGMIGDFAEDFISGGKKKKGMGKMIGNFLGEKGGDLIGGLIGGGHKGGGDGGGGGGGRAHGEYEDYSGGYGGSGPNTKLQDLIGGLVGGPENLGKLIGDGLHRFLGINPETGRIIGSMAGNIIFNLGGKDNILGNLGKIILDNMISGKWKRKVDPFIPPEPVQDDDGYRPRPSPPRPDAVGGAQDFNDLRQQALDTRTLYEDREFPATDSSLFFSQRPPKRIEWLRPGEIVRDPLFFEEGHTRFDVKQGELGDCWMLVAVACLTLRDELFYRVVPPDQSFTENYAGIFHFQFWQYGKWVDVVIDDRLPTYSGKLLYLHSASNREFWSALVEKAYAKLHGSYEALKGGTSTEALEDFTGGLTELINLKQNPPRHLLQMMLKGFQMGSLLGASIQGSPGQMTEGKLSNGLVTGHAYSVTGIKVVNGPNGRTPILRIRNPWGTETEWRGPWSDGSPEWRYVSDEEKQGMDLKFKHDGEFWISYDDYMRNFDTLEICNLGPEVMDEIQEMVGKRPRTAAEWNTEEFHTAWVRGRSAGGCRNYIDTFAMNPQFYFSLTDPDPYDDDKLCSCILSVVQKFRRQLKHKGVEMLPIGFAIYQIDGRPGGSLNRNFFSSHKAAGRSPVFINLREVCGRFRFPPGEYIMVPSTFEPNQQGDFMVRVFSEGPLSSEKL